MIYTWDSNNREVCLHVTVKCAGKKRFFLSVGQKDRPNSLYAKREMVVDGERTVYFSFPITPEMMVISIHNMSDKTDNAFTCSFEEGPLKKYNVWLDSETNDFLHLNFRFSQNCGFIKASPQGRIFERGPFIIKYYPVIVDAMSGQPLSTPARIGHNTGKIDVAKCKFDRFTFAERVIILLHEFSHKYRNPKLGLAIENEIGADINALYIYLGLGFSKIDAINVFANVFLKAQSPGNIKRMRAIVDYIARFENGDYAQLS